MASEVDLEIGGMTCSSCALRIEKKLNRMPGVTATVNYATEKAHVVLPDGVSVDDAIRTVEATGYAARTPLVASLPETTSADPEVDALRQRLLICIALTVPVVLMAMVPALQFTYWQWASLTLAAPVVMWGAWPFHRAAWVNLRHGAATMDTLISLGVLAAFGWSLWALFLGGAGEPGMSMTFTLLPHDQGQQPEIYLEVAAAVTVFILTGRYLEARAKARSGEALRALASLGAKDVAVVRDSVEQRVPIGDLRTDDAFVVRPGEKVATDGVVVEGSSAVDNSMVTGEPVPVEVGPGDAVAAARSTPAGACWSGHRGRHTQLARSAWWRRPNGQGPVQRLADKVSAVFVPVCCPVASPRRLIAGAGPQAAFPAAVAVSSSPARARWASRRPPLMVGTAVPSWASSSGPQISSRPAGRHRRRLRPAPSRPSAALVEVIVGQHDAATAATGGRTLRMRRRSGAASPSVPRASALRCRGVLSTRGLGPGSRRRSPSRPEPVAQQRVDGRRVPPRRGQARHEPGAGGGRRDAWQGCSCVRHGQPAVPTPSSGDSYRPVLLTGTTPRAATRGRGGIDVRADVLETRSPSSRACRRQTIVVVGDGVTPPHWPRPTGDGHGTHGRRQAADITR